MTDNDQLLARVDAWCDDVLHQDHSNLARELEARDMLYELAAALRAALATRPKPLFEGTMLDMEDWVHGWDSVDALQGVVVYRAAAGSATPTECICPRFQDTGGYRIADLCCPVHGVDGTDPGDGPWDAPAAAGSAAPQEDCPVRGDHMLRSTQEACPACTPQTPHR